MFQLEEVGWKYIKNGKLKAEIVNRTRRYREVGKSRCGVRNSYNACLCVETISLTFLSFIVLIVAMIVIIIIIMTHS